MGKILNFILIGLLLLSPTLYPSHPTQSTQKVVIIGSGVGALTSALYLQRAGINTLVLEGPNPGGAIAQSPNVHNWPGEIEIHGQNLIDKIRAQAIHNGAQIVSKEAISVDFSSRPFSISVRDVYDPSKTETISAAACIIAMGSNPKLLGIPGESGDKGYWTKGVYSCAVCDGSLYKGKTVAVIGGGDSAIIEADYLSKIAKKVYLVLRSDQFRTVEIARKNELLKKSNVEVLYNTQIREIAGNGTKVTHLNLSTQNQLDVDGVFVAIGATPNTNLFTSQLAMDSGGYIKLSNDQQTSIPGVFAIGDIVDPYYKQAICAAGDGAKAALQVERFLSIGPTLPQSPPAKVINNRAAIREISKPDDLYNAIGKGTLLVEFYSPYCGPCKQFYPSLQQASTQYGDQITFLQVDVTKFSELASSYNVFGVPTVMIFDKQGKMITKGSGLKEAEKILTDLEKYTSK